MNLLIGLIVFAFILVLLGIGTFLGGKELNTSCSGDATCAYCDGDVDKCESREDS